MKRKILAILIMVTITLLIGVAPEVSAETPVLSPGMVMNATDVQARHENDLMSRPGVQGVGIGVKDGQVGILILVDEQRGESEIPAAVGGLPVIVKKVGRIVAHQIMNLGESVGNDLLCGGYCDVGTAGFKVCDNTTSNVGGFVTNNHVAASGCPGKCPNNAPIGTSLFHPGLVDNAPVCTTTGATNVGTLNRFISIVLDGSTQNDVDAAFVQSTDALVSDTIQGLGLQSNTTAAVSVGDAVCKSGRTTGVTCGTITGINLTIDVSYDEAGTANPCGGIGPGRFRNTVEYSPTAPDTTMSEGGDSGAPVILNDGTNRAVAINFAGDGVHGYGIPIGTVLTQLNVSLCSDIPEPPIADAGGPYNANCQGLTTTVQLDGTGSSDPDGDALTYAWTTNCPGGSFDDPSSPTAVLTVDTSPGCSVNCSVTLNVTDPAGSGDSATASVTISDSLPPVITCPVDIRIECDASSDPRNTGFATATDNCAPIPTVTHSDATTPGSCPQASTITRTWTATDNCGNSSSCVQTIQVVDTTPPVLLGVPGGVTVECDSVPAPAVVTAADNCDTSVPVVFSETRTDGSCSSHYILTRTWTATDSCGNTTTATQVITVQDTTAPTIGSVAATPNVLWPPNHKMVPVAVTAIATDNCDSTPVCTITGVSSNEPVNGLGDGDTSPDWMITGSLTVDLRAERSGTGTGRIYTLTVTCADACGNSSAGTTTVRVPHDQKKK